MRALRIFSSSRPMRLPSFLLPSSCVLALLYGMPATSRAQLSLDTLPPQVTITPGGGTFLGDTLSVTIEWCDDTALDPDTRKILLNGQDITSGFSFEWTTGPPFCENAAVSEDVITLSPNENAFYAEIRDASGDCGGRYTCLGSDSVEYTYNHQPVPIVSTAPHNGDLLTPGPFDLVHTYTKADHVSLDAPQGVTLFYSSAQAAPRGLVTVDAWNPPAGTNPPDSMSIRLKDPSGAWVTFTSGTQEIFYRYADTDSLRLTAQFDARTISSGAYRYTVVVRSWWLQTGATKETSVPVRVLIQNERNSPIFPGWTIAGHQRLLVQGDTLLLLDGAGTMIAFDEVQTDLYASGGDFSKIRKLSSTQYARFWSDSTKAYLRLNSGGVIAVDSVLDRLGNKVRYVHDGQGRLARIIDAVGESTYLFYSSTWDGLDYINWLGYVTYFSGSTSTDDLLSVERIQNTGIVDSFTYDDHRMTSWTDREGATTDYTYDDWNKLETVTLAQITLHDETSVRPEIQMSAPENRSVPSSPSAVVTEEDVFGLVIGPRGDTTRSWYNELGQPVKVIDAVGRQTERSYTGAGLSTGVTLPSGQTFSYSWSGDRLTSETVTGMRTTTYEHEPVYGLVDTVKVEGELAWSYTYDSLGRRTTAKIGHFDSLYHFYADDRGRDTLVVEPMGHTTRYLYDSTWGNLRQVVRDDGQTTTWEFDSLGRVSRTISPTHDTTEVEYDELSRVTAVWDPLNPNPTRMHYGPIYVDSITNPKGEVHRFVHNALGWVTEEYGPASATLADSFGYDVAGNVVRWTNRNGEVVQYAYDLIGRRTSVTAPGRVFAYGYDSSGNDAYIWGSSGDGSTTWSTDTTWLHPLGMTDSLKTVRGASVYGVGFEYDHWSGRPTKIIDWYNGGRELRFGYNGQGQADTIFVRGKKTWVDTRNSNRQVVTRLFESADLKQTQQYSATNRRAEIKWLKDSSGATLVSRNFGFDEADRITDMDVEGDDSLYHYEYDRLGRLTKSEQYEYGVVYCTYSGDWPYIDCSGGGGTLADADTFTYDEIGNRTDHGAVVEAGSRLTQITVHGQTVSYTYDDAGNVTRREESGGKDQYLYWNALGQLDSVKTLDGSDTTVSRYRYDAFGQRIRVQDGGQVLESMWVAAHVLFDVEDSTATEYTYLTGTDRPHSMRRNGTTYYYLTDHLGSVAAVVDSAGTEKNTCSYDVWGFGSCSEQVGNRLRFTGREYDGATGFYYVRARYYDSITGRFLSEDPMGLSAGMNPYAYAANNPLTRRDPTGLTLYECEDTETGARCKEHDSDEDTDWVECPGFNRQQCANLVDLILKGGENAPSLQEAADHFRERVVEVGWDQATAEWVRMVCGECAWDFKVGYEGEERDVRDAYGNLIFGATGNVVGFPSWMLRMAAGWDQRGEDLFAGRQTRGSGFVGPNFGDNRVDAYHIQQGYRMGAPFRPDISPLHGIPGARAGLFP